MDRRSLVIGAASAALLAGCASSAPPAGEGFTSERISVITRGSGPDIILIPGLTSHRDVWAPTAAALEGHYRFHIVQVDGFAGFPAGANSDGDVAAPVAEEITRYINETHLTRPALIGHSMGGTIAMMIAARHPDQVGRLMVVDMIPFMGAMFGPPGTTAESVRGTADQIRNQMRSAPPGAAAPMIEQMIAGMTRTESARPILVQQARDSDRNTVANAFHELIVTDLRPELGRITAPTTVLFVIPPNAPITPAQYEAYTRLSFANIRQARLIKVEDSYHFIMIDQPARFQAEVATFMTR